MTDFQIVDILADDLRNHDKGKDEFVVTLYGIDRSTERLVCHVKGFKPYFFVKIPNDWDRTKTKFLMKQVLSFHASQHTKKKFYQSPACSQPKLETYKDFYGLYWNEEAHEGEGGVQHFQFAKIECPTHKDMKQLIQGFKDYYGDCLKHLDTLSEIVQEWFKVETTANCDSNLLSLIHI